MGKNKNRHRQTFPPITVAAIEAARGAVTTAQATAPEPKHVTEPEPTTHLVLALENSAGAEDAAWAWFSSDEYRRGRAQGKTPKQVSRSLRRDSFLAGYRAGKRKALSEASAR